MKTILILLLLLPIHTSAIRCVNFYGIETERKAPVCDWAHEPEWYLQKLKDGFGLDTVRLPYSRDYVMDNDWEKMDAIIQTCNEMNIKVIVDYHRTYQSHQGETPTEEITLGQFLDTHLAVLNRYYDKVWGVSAFNEIQIRDGNYTDQINHMIVNAIESQFPGMYRYFLGCSDWGHNCQNATLPTGFENRSYVDIHQYRFTDKAEEMTTAFPDRIPSANYFVGEIGAKTEELPWLRSYLGYLEWRGINNVCFWTIAHSTDTGGLWKDDCETIEQEKMDLLADFFNHTQPACRRRMLRFSS